GGSERRRPPSLLVVARDPKREGDGEPHSPDRPCLWRKDVVTAAEDEVERLVTDLGDPAERELNRESGPFSRGVAPVEERLGVETQVQPVGEGVRDARQKM